MPKKDDISKDCSQPLPNQGTVSNTWKVSSSMVDICPVLPAQVASRAWISLRGMNDILTYIYLIFYGKSVGIICVGLSLYRRSWFSMWWFQTTCDLNISAATNPWKGPTPIWSDPVPLGAEFAGSWGCITGKKPTTWIEDESFFTPLCPVGIHGTGCNDSPFDHECQACDICVESIS